jgi:hypothetical protein
MQARLFHPHMMSQLSVLAMLVPLQHWRWQRKVIALLWLARPIPGAMGGPLR